MSYSEENGQVVLRMSKADYENLLKVFRWATTGIVHKDVLEFLDRLNSGNPNYTAVQGEEKHGE